MEVVKSFPVAIVYLFLMGAFVQPLIRTIRARAVSTVLLTATGFVLSLLTVNYVQLGGTYFYRVSQWPAPWGIEFKIGYMEAFLAAVVCGIGFLIALYGTGMVDKEIRTDSSELYYPLFLVVLSGMAGMVFTGDLFNMYVFIEITSLSACGLIAVKANGESTEATAKYLVYSSLASGCILLAIALLYGITGNLNMRYIHYVLEQYIPHYQKTTLMALCLLVVGFGLKAGLFPLHIWLPDAHSSAITTSSVLLSALVLKAYIVAMVKVFTGLFGVYMLGILPLKPVLMFLGAGSVMFGSLLAVTQTNLKRMLAYSSVVQMGYIFLGLSLFNRTAFTGALFHILNHALAKASLFLACGNIKYHTGIQRVDQMKGLGYSMPLTMGTFTVAAFSMIGIPLTSGFNSKWYLGLGSIESGRIAVLIIIVVSSLLNAAYYLPPVVAAFFHKPDRKEGLHETVRLPWTSVVPMVVLALLILLMGLYPDPVIEYISKVYMVF